MVDTAASAGAVDLASIPGSPIMRSPNVLDHSFHEAEFMVRISGDTIDLTPPLIVSEAAIDEIIQKTAASIKAAARRREAQVRPCGDASIGPTRGTARQLQPAQPLF